MDEFLSNELKRTKEEQALAAVDESDIEMYSDGAKHLTHIAIEDAIKQSVVNGDTINPEDRFIVSQGQEYTFMNINDEYRVHNIPESIVQNKLVSDPADFIYGLMNKKPLDKNSLRGTDLPFVNREYKSKIESHAGEILNKTVSISSVVCIDDDEDVSLIEDNLNSLLSYLNISEQVFVDDGEEEEESEIDVEELLKKIKIITKKVKIVKSKEKEDLNLLYQEFQKSKTAKKSKFTVSSEPSVPLVDLQEDVMYAKKIIDKMKGKYGVKKSVAPSKKFDKRNITSDFSDKIYVKKMQEEGKYLKVLFIVDMSGSMGGQYIHDSARIIDIFRLVQKEGLCEGEVIYSVDGSMETIDLKDFNAKSNPFFYTNACGSDEGVESTLTKNKKKVSQADIVYCLTDGDLVGEPIRKKYWNKVNKNVIACYNARVTGSRSIKNKRDKLLEWFDKVSIGKDFEATVNNLLHIGLKG